jgi:hypothetical protein
MTKRQAEEEARKKMEQTIHPTVSNPSDSLILYLKVILIALCWLR